MPERWLGLVVSGDAVTAVDLEVPPTGPLTLQADQSWKLQKGDRAAAYRIMHQRVADYIRDNAVGKAVVKASAVAKGGGLSHLHSAELRGVVMAAAASSTDTQTYSKALVSRTFGERKADEYVSDDDFWEEQIVGSMRKGSREAALMVLAVKDDQ
jgi:hypothetical protein